MHVAEIWRYPVKSMAGEQLQSARLTTSGIDGDRIIQARNARGFMVTSRTHPGLLGHRATLVDGEQWGQARSRLATVSSRYSAQKDSS